MKTIRRAAILTVVSALCFFACSCGAGDELNSTDFFAMDTYMTIRAQGATDAQLSEAAELVTGLDDLLSVTREGSVIRELNENGSAHLPERARNILQSAIRYCAETGGALDVTVYPLVRAWGFTTGENRVPDDAELAALLENVGYEKLAVHGGDVSMPDGTGVDLGAVAKGYAGDRVIELLRTDGVTSAIIDLGGNVQTLGSRPDGAPWRVAVRDPENEGGVVGVLSVSDLAVVTTGGYQRYFTADDGTVYHHVIDPATGYPADSGLLSATVVGPSGFACDALSTAFFVMGESAALDYCASHPDIGALLVTSDRRVVLTPDLASSFELDPECGYVLN